MVIGNAVQLKFERPAIPDKLGAILFAQQQLLVRLTVLKLKRLRPCEHDLFAIRTPERPALHVLRVIRPGQRRVGAGGAVIDRENAFNGKEELRKSQIGFSHEDRLVLHGADYLLAVG